MSQILIERDPAPMKLDVLMVEEWPLVRDVVGESERYFQHTETSYIAEGSGYIRLPTGESFEFAEGDLVTVLPDTHCTWHITEAVERHYSKG